MPIPSHVRLWEPWQAISAPQAEVLTDQLRRELSPEHVLYGVEAKAVAKATNRDDLLLELYSYSKSLAVVHLTWSKEAQADPRWPTTRFFATWDDWVCERLIPDSVEFPE